MAHFSTEGRTATGRDLFKDTKKKKAETPPSATAAPVRLGEHGRYQIKSGRLAGEYVARAFPKPPTATRGMIAEAKGATEEAAIAALHEAIDAREARRTDDRRSDTTLGFSVPSAEEYAEAVAQVTLSRRQRAMLVALAEANEDGLTQLRLARAAGYKSNASTNRALASAGLLIANYLSLEATADAATSDGSRFLGYRGAQQNDEDPGNLILHTELRDAMKAIGA